MKYTCLEKSALIFPIFQKSDFLEFSIFEIFIQTQKFSWESEIFGPRDIFKIEIPKSQKSRFKNRDSKNRLLDWIFSSISKSIKNPVQQIPKFSPAISKIRLLDWNIEKSSPANRKIDCWTEIEKFSPAKIRDFYQNRSKIMNLIEIISNCPWQYHCPLKWLFHKESSILMLETQNDTTAPDNTLFHKDSQFKAWISILI